MAPRRPPAGDQQDNLRQTLEAFTTGLHDALLSAVETALTTVLQNQHHHQHDDHVQHQTPEDDDSEVDEFADNIFAVPDREDRPRRAECRGALIHNHRDDTARTNPIPLWDSGFKLDIPEFTGSLNPEDFLDWLSSVEEVLDFKSIPDDIRVPLVATRFKSRAMAWWQQLKESRRHSGKSRIDTWERMKKHLRRSFLPYNYERTLYNKIQALRQGNRSVDEYATEFFHLSARSTLMETEL